MSLTLKQKLATVLATKICKDMKCVSPKNDTIDIEACIEEALALAGGSIHDQITVDDTHEPQNTETKPVEDSDSEADGQDDESQSDDEDGHSGF